MFLRVFVAKTLAAIAVGGLKLWTEDEMERLSTPVPAHQSWLWRFGGQDRFL